MKKRYLIITASDEKYGDFLINHWLRSLIANQNLDEIDIAVLDYGLSSNQISVLTKNGIKVYKCNRDGHVVNIRFRDMQDFLKNNKYEQILSCDSGDIIFQKSISKIFKENENEYRAVCEDIQNPMIEYAILHKAFPNKLRNDLLKTLINKKMINGGLIIAPYRKFLYLCKEIYYNIIDKSLFGPDQVLLNYILYNKGFIELDKDYNYIPTTSNDKFKIKEGFFYNDKNEKISIVHNAGNIDIFRPIKNFGYGNKQNQLNTYIYITLRTFYKTTYALNKIVNAYKNNIQKYHEYFKNHNNHRFILTNRQYL